MELPAITILCTEDDTILRKIIIYVNDFIFVSNIKHLALTNLSPIKVNFRLVKVLEFFNRLNFNIFYKSSKKYTVSNILLWLARINFKVYPKLEHELNIVHESDDILIVNLRNDFRKKTLDSY